MSRGDDDRDEAGGFLGRWSRRKAQARTRPESETDGGEASAAKGAPEGRADLQADLKKDEEVFDLTKLPSLEEITGQTNLSDFMRKEVPAALRNAALKKAWALDPAIRDYVNPAMEYAYDWNTPGGVPGNGPIDTAIETLREMVASAQSTPTAHTLDERDSTEAPARSEESGVTHVAEEPTPVRLSEIRDEEKAPSETMGSESAAQSVPEIRTIPVEEAQKPRRRHGGAAPA